VYIHPDDGCYSLVGRSGGRQPLSLEAGCIDRGTIQHELMHTVGFFHEQSRTDRDDWVKIQLDKVRIDAQDQFDKYDLAAITDLGEVYDYGSIMHYGAFAFTATGWPTIVPRKNITYANSVMGQRRAFSATDIRKINKLYKCPKAPSSTGSPPREQSSTIDVDNGAKPCVDGRLCWLTKFYRKCADADGILRKQCPVHCDACAVVSTTTTGIPDSTTPTATTTDVTSEPTECNDKKPSCDAWAKYCEQPEFIDFMQRNCARTCNKCGTDDATASTTVATATTDSRRRRCADMESASTCQFAATTYDCRTSDYLKRRCVRTCALQLNTRC
jgi:astacin